jgi:hypothetical protein
MIVEPTIAPLSLKTDIYGIRDERGELIGTGTREVCEVMLFLIKLRRGVPLWAPHLAYC